MFTYINTIIHTRTFTLLYTYTFIQSYLIIRHIFLYPINSSYEYSQYIHSLLVYSSFITYMYTVSILVANTNSTHTFTHYIYVLILLVFTCTHSVTITHIPTHSLHMEISSQIYTLVQYSHLNLHVHAYNICMYLFMSITTFYNSNTPLCVYVDTIVYIHNNKHNATNINVLLHYLCI